MLDMLDGRIARFTSTGSEFGEELDSLVDAISFGVAPALIIYFLFLADGGPWSWTLSFLYVARRGHPAGALQRRAGGVGQGDFHGLPSPTAGLTLATFYPFTQTAVLPALPGHLPWNMLTPAA
jgi:CDP-diacylglycerol---serine O-phosphatidyltransferase